MPSPVLSERRLTAGLLPVAVVAAHLLQLLLLLRRQDGVDLSAHGRHGLRIARASAGVRLTELLDDGLDLRLLLIAKVQRLKALHHAPALVRAVCSVRAVFVGLVAGPRVCGFSFELRLLRGRQNAHDLLFHGFARGFIGRAAFRVRLMELRYDGLDTRLLIGAQVQVAHGVHEAAMMMMPAARLRGAGSNWRGLRNSRDRNCQRERHAGGDKERSE